MDKDEVDTLWMRCFELASIPLYAMSNEMLGQESELQNALREQIGQETVLELYARTP